MSTSAVLAGQVLHLNRPKQQLRSRESSTTFAMTVTTTTCPHPSGCSGSSWPTLEYCLAHLETAQRVDALNHLSRGADVDLQGVECTEELLRDLKNAVQNEFGTARFDSSTFHGRADFDGVTFLEAAHFENAIFHDIASFNNATFHRQGWFQHSTFNDFATFDSANFSFLARFDDAVFGGDCWFAGAHLDNARFGKTKVTGDAFFEKVSFTGDARFEEAIFSGKTVFSDAKFHKDLSLENARIQGGLWFEQTKVFGNALFSRSTLKGDLKFSKAIFEGEARFQAASLAGPAWFHGVTFNGGAWFDGATLAGAGFTRSSFAAGCWFVEAIFNKEVGFEHVTFQGDTEFQKARFVDVACFDSVTFKSEARFDGARFEADASFKEATFGSSWLGPIVSCGALSLDGARLTAPIRATMAAKAVSMRRLRCTAAVAFHLRFATVSLDDADLAAPLSLIAHPVPLTLPTAATPGSASPFEPQALTNSGPSTVTLTSLTGVDTANLILKDIDLSECVFSGAHRLDQIRMEGRCTFGHPPATRVWRLPIMRWTKRSVLWEERQWRHHKRSNQGWIAGPASMGSAAPGPHDLAATYRQLRKALEDQKNEPGAADFYYGEMEMRRHDRKTPEGERYLLHVYWALAGYALRGLRAIMALMAAMSVTVVLMMAFGLPDDDPRPIISGNQPLPGQQVLLTIKTPDPSLTLPFPQRWTWDRFGKGSQVVLNSVVFRSSGQNLTHPGNWIEMVSRFTEPTLLAFAALAARSRVKR